MSIDQNYRLPEGTAQSVADYSNTIMERGEPLVAELVDRGLDEAQAANVIVDVLLRAGCKLAILIRRDMLAGTPDRDVWLSRCGELFDQSIQQLAARAAQDAKGDIGDAL